MIKYILISEEMLSKNDRDMHKISASQLLKLYKLSNKYCILVNDKEKLRGYRKDFIELYPLYSGNYEEVGSQANIIFKLLNGLLDIEFKLWGNGFSIY